MASISTMRLAGYRKPLSVRKVTMLYQTLARPAIFSLGTALLPSRRPRVLLIDEIDKSDIDLPNDLLNIFEEGEYYFPEFARLSHC